jgi:hypothetical protein
MEVTKDEYELPVAVASSPSELARMRGVNPNVISSTISHAKKLKRPKYYKVEIHDEEEE